MNRAALAAAMCIAACLAACGGSGSGPTPPPPAGPFSNASLNGPYAFSMVGEDLNGAVIARIGSFVADGNGTITAGLEDVVDGNAGANEVSFTGGTYTIQSNGRGLLVLQAATGGGLQLNIGMISTGQGILVETDLNATSSGRFSVQTPSQFSTNALTGNFIFDFNGVSFPGSAVVPESTIGQLALDGNGNITGGTLDDNSGTPSGATAVGPGTYEIDATGSGSSFGRGTMSFAGRSFAFYIVNSTHIKVVEEDLLAATTGDSYQQSANIPGQDSAINGSFAYLVSGASVLGSQGADARVARFTADGTGGIAAISFDENNDGSARHISQGSNISKASYAMDAANSGSGRGTFTFTDSGGGTYSYVFYFFSPTQALLQDTSPGVVADGALQAQTGAPFTTAGLAGNYVFNWSGIEVGTQDSIPFEEDYVGQYVLASAASSNLTGTVDYTQLGLSGKNLFTDIGIAGGLTIRSDGTANNTLRLVNNGSPSTTYNFVLYVVNATTSYMLCTDDTRITAGVAYQQSQ